MAATIPIIPRVIRTSDRVNAKYEYVDFSFNFTKNLEGVWFLLAPPPRKFSHSLLFHNFSPSYHILIV